MEQRERDEAAAMYRDTRRTYGAAGPSVARFMRGLIRDAVNRSMARTLEHCNTGKGNL